jgi:lipid A 3-O-deacylase
MIIRKPSFKIFWLSALLAGACPASFAVDSVALDLGNGNRTSLARIGVQWAWVGGYWDLTLDHWRSNQYQNQPGNTHNLTAIGITPVFRYQKDSLTGMYAEGGIGLYYLFDLYDNNGRQLSTNLEFGSHIGVGYAFQHSLDFGLKIQHFSNGSIKKPNGGVNFIILRTGYRF